MEIKIFERCHKEELCAMSGEIVISSLPRGSPLLLGEILDK